MAELKEDKLIVKKESMVKKSAKVATNPLHSDGSNEDQAIGSSGFEVHENL